MYHMEREAFISYGKLVAPAFTWQRLAPMEQLAFSIDKANYKIELFYRRKYAMTQYILIEGQIISIILLCLDRVLVLRGIVKVIY